MLIIIISQKEIIVVDTEFTCRATISVRSANVPFPRLAMQHR